MAQSLYLDNGPVINNMRRASRKTALRRNRQNVSVDGVRHFLCWPPKLLPALIDCNSSLPEGRWGYRRRTAGESSSSAETNKQAISYPLMCNKLTQLLDQMCTLFAKCHSFQMRDAAPPFVHTDLCMFSCHVSISHTWPDPHGPHPQLPPKVTWSRLRTYRLRAD